MTHLHFAQKLHILLLFIYVSQNLTVLHQSYKSLQIKLQYCTIDKLFCAKK